MRMKKILSIFMSLVMLTSITAGLDLSADANTSGDFEYRLRDDGTAEIMDYNGSAAVLVIPDTLDGYSVTSIGSSAFQNSRSIESVIILNSIVAIGSRAFYNCTSLESITIGYGLSRIDAIAHTAPTGCDAFYGCTSLGNITVDENNQYFSSSEGVLFNKNKTALIQYPIGNTRTSYIIPDSVTIIGSYAFKNCQKLENVTIPDSVTNIGQYAFQNSKNLKIVNIGSSVTTIGTHAFPYCYNLQKIYVNTNNKVYFSKNGVLYNKDSKELIQYPVGNKRKSFSIPSGTKRIGDYAFGGCKYLKNLEIPRSISYIGAGAFYYTEEGNVYYSGSENAWESIIFKGTNWCGNASSKEQEYAGLNDWKINYNCSYINKLSASKNELSLNYYTVSGVSGYQVQYATDSKFKKNKKTVTVKGAKNTSKTVKNLKSKKTYYVRVRTYKTVNGKKTYSAWSKAKSVKTK